MSLDVYVTLRVGDGSEWAQSTDISPNLGAEDTQWKFDADEMCGEAMASYLCKNVINLTVKDSNESSADKYVGKAKLSLEEVLLESNSNKMMTLTGDLHSHDESEYSAGEYSVKLKYIVPVKDSGRGSEHEEGLGGLSLQGQESGDDLVT